jgi:hypothetical protein
MVRALYQEAAASKAAAPSSTNDDVATAPAACRPEHGFHAFDTLYCTLTRAQPIKPAFTDDKLCVPFPSSPLEVLNFYIQPALRDVEHTQVQFERERCMEHTPPWLYWHV